MWRQAMAAIFTMAPIWTPALADPFAGLWVGAAHLDQVSGPDGEMTSVEAPFRFSLLIHQQAGAAALITQAVILGEGDAQRLLIGDEVVLTDLTALPDHMLAAAEKFATVGYDMPGGVAPMTGAIGAEANGEISAILSIGPYDDANPFGHRFHPDHDNLTDAGARLRDDAEVYALTRHMRLKRDAALSGEGRIVGVFEEDISGLGAKEIRTRGVFVLERVVRAGEGR